MEWNLEKLLEIRNNLLKLSENDTLDRFERYKFANDLYIVNLMIDYMQNKQSIHEVDYDLTTIVDSEYYRKVIAWINETGDAVFLNARPLGDESVKIRKFYRKNCMFETDSLKILQDFFDYYNPELNTFLENMIKNNQIQFNEKNNLIFGKDNYLLNFMSSGDSFIINNNTLHLIDFQHLAKNVQSAYDFSKKDNSIKQNTSLSPLGYAKGKFAQLAFIDYLKNTNYASEASAVEGKQLNDFFQMVDNGVGYFVTPAEALIINSHLKNGKYSTYIKHILSNMQAYDWLKSYRENPEKLKDELSEFDKQLGVSELEGINSKKIQQMTDSVKSIESSYVRNRTLYH